MTPRKRGGPQAIVGRKRSTEESVTLRGKWATFSVKERWTLLLACGCKKVFRGMGGGPKAKTACPNGHPTGFVAESKQVAS